MTVPRMVRQFPYPLNVGTDICHIPRIYSILNSARAARFVRRVLTSDEVARRGPTSPIARIIHQDQGLLVPRGHAGKEGSAVSLGRPHGDPDRGSELWDAAVFMAGRFAAKEAAIKAHPHRHLTFHDITIAPRSAVEESADASKIERPRLGSGPPIAIVKATESEGQDQEAMISISHDGDYATAVCMGFI